MTSLRLTTLLVVYTPLVTVAAFPLMFPPMVLLKVLLPAIIWFPSVITPPAASTFVASVTSAKASIPLSLVLSLSVIMAPEPTLVTSLRSETLLVV